MLEDSRPETGFIGTVPEFFLCDREKTLNKSQWTQIQDIGST